MTDPLAVFTAAAEFGGRYRVLYGGAGGAKSHFVAQDQLHRCVQDGRERVLVLRKVKADLRGSCYAMMADLVAAYGWTNVEVLDLLIRFDNGARILFAGLDEPMRLKSITGITRIWVEEANELEDTDLAHVDLRIRGIRPDMVGQITLTFNPDKGSIALFDYLGVTTTDLPTRSWKVYEDDQVFVQHTTWLDNPHAGADYVQVFRRIGGAMQAVYEHGQLGTTDAPDQLIQYLDVKAAFGRKLEDAWTDGRQRMGVDVARFGADETAITIGEGFALDYIELQHGQNTARTGQRIITLAAERSIPAELITVDAVGLGGGSADVAREGGLDALVDFIGGANMAEAVEVPEGVVGLLDLRFNNLRSQAWFFYAEQMQAGLVAFGPDLDDDHKRKLQEDLLAPKYRYNRDKEIEVEPKIGRSKAWGIRSRLGRSPDIGDAEVMRLFGEHASLPLQVFL